MLLFTLLVVLLIASIIGFIVAEEEGFDSLFGASLLVGFLDLAVLVILICELPWKKSVEYDIAKYEELKIAIEQVDNTSSENNSKIVAQSALFEKIYKMNTNIEKHRIYNDSWWLGWLYSEKIGNLNKLNYVEKNKRE